MSETKPIRNENDEWTSILGPNGAAERTARLGRYGKIIEELVNERTAELRLNLHGALQDVEDIKADRNRWMNKYESYKRQNTELHRTIAALRKKIESLEVGDQYGFPETEPAQQEHQEILDEMTGHRGMER